MIKRVDDELKQQVFDRAVETVAANEEPGMETTVRQQDESVSGKQNEILQTILEHVPAMIIVFDEEGRIKLVNRECERTLGWSQKEIEEQHQDIFAACYSEPQDRRKFMDFVSESKGEWADFKTMMRDGRVIDTTWKVAGLSDGTTIGIGKDSTERKQAEQELKKREAQLMETQALAHLGSWEWDLITGEVNWSDELYRIWGVNREEFSGTFEAILGRIHPDDREYFTALAERAFQEHDSYSCEHRIIRQEDGMVRTVQSRAAVVVDEAGRAVKMFGTGQDITERRRAEEQLKNSNEKLRALSASIRSAREEEGTRIAREIHDELGSALTSLKWEMEWLDKIFTESENQSQSKLLREKIASMMRLTDTVINTVRRIASELRPSILDDLGLAEAIEWQAQQFQLQTGIICRCECSLEGVDLPQDKSTSVFRIFQEALTNILRHARATSVDITIRKDGGELVLTISDNGRGITEDEKSGQHSLGLLGMRERAHLIGGKISINGIKGRGTVIVVRVPISD
jgi:PAS domain S-box-containing protein